MNRRYVFDAMRSDSNYFNFFDNKKVYTQNQIESIMKSKIDKKELPNAFGFCAVPDAKERLYVYIKGPDGLVHHRDEHWPEAIFLDERVVKFFKGKSEDKKSPENANKIDVSGLNMGQKTAIMKMIATFEEENSKSWYAEFERWSNDSLTKEMSPELVATYSLSMVLSELKKRILNRNDNYGGVLWSSIEECLKEMQVPGPLHKC